MNKEELEKYYDKEVKNLLNNWSKAHEKYGKCLDKFFPNLSGGRTIIPEFTPEEWEKLEEMRKETEEKRIKFDKAIKRWLALFF